jgi:isochorismate synthase
LSNRQLISEKIQSLLLEKSVFCFYKKPNSQQVNAFIQKDKVLYNSIDYKESGFVFAPFDSSKKAVLIPQKKADFLSFSIPKEINSNATFSLTEKIENKKLHGHLVSKSIRFIRQGKANKIVISRVIKKPIDLKQIGVLYENLIHTYPNAFVYIWQHPKIGLWIGATPETLIKIDKKNYETMALAGTQIFKENLVWKNKEKEEQQWVEDYIYNRLKPISTNINTSASYTHKAGHLAHIRTAITGKIATNTSLKQLVDALHPTPAVCGTPKDVAQNFILKNEAYDREFYTGFLGELNLDSQTKLFVNLRCMKINKNTSKIYVGGGITKDSIPDNEWTETQNKAMILGRFF